MEGKLRQIISAIFLWGIVNRKTELKLQEEFIKKHGPTKLPPYWPGKDCLWKKFKKYLKAAKFNRYRFIIDCCHYGNEKQREVAKFLGLSQQAISKYLIKFKNILSKGKKDKKKAIIFLNSTHSQSETSKLLEVTQQYVSKVLIKHGRERRR